MHPSKYSSDPTTVDVLIKSAVPLSAVSPSNIVTIILILSILCCVNLIVTFGILRPAEFDSISSPPLPYWFVTLFQNLQVENVNF